MTPHDVARCCYATAYYVLPPIAAQDSQGLLERLSHGRVAALAFFLMGCQIRGLEPEESDAETMQSFSVHNGKIHDRYDYSVIQYPTPPHLDLSAELEAATPEQMVSMMQQTILGPYFSAIVRDTVTGKAQCFVLGQSADGFTTFRSVNREMNANLGRGCEPNLDAFLSLLKERAANPGEIVAGVRFGTERPKKRWWQFWK